MKLHETNKKISERDFQAAEEIPVWAQSEEARDFAEKIHMADTTRKMYERQALRLENAPVKPEQRNMRSVFMKYLMTSKLGLGISSTGACRRSTDDQSKFRDELIKVSNSKHEDPKVVHLWCPMTQKWVPPQSTTAAHIFAYQHGQDCMDLIFGEEAAGELFSPNNGILMSDGAEQRLDKGYIVIIPNLAPNVSPAALSLWQNLTPKEYKIVVLQPDAKGMDAYIDSPTSGSKKVWKDLHGSKLEFRSDHRPRARYLYFLYCTSMLRKSWHDKERAQALGGELEKPYWGTPGEYLHRNMLLAFVEEMGHEHEILLEGSD